MSSRHFEHWFAGAFLLLAAIPTMVAQTASTAALTGTVTDATGAVVARVTVTATNTATNQSRTVTTDAAGVYRIPLLEPGSYRVRFAAPGFKTAEVPAATLTVTETATLDRTLEVGTQAEQVTVEADVEVLQAATSSLGTTVTGQTISTLPLAARNFTQVLGMSSGVAVDVTNGAAFGKGTQNMSVNGLDSSKNNFQMDGVNMNNIAGAGNAADFGLYTGIAVPSPDSLQEFKIQTSTYDASFGRNPGANVNVVTKSGTNGVHGSLFEYFRNEALNANDFFYNKTSPLSAQGVKQTLKQNQFGGTVGGPIKKDKLFYFGSYQGTRQRNGVVGQGSSTVTLYPIPGNRESADFQQRLGAALCNGGPGVGAPLVPSVPITCDGSTINPVAIALLRVKLPDGSYYIPSSGTNATTTRLISNPAKFTENQYLTNVDWVLNPNNSLQMKWFFLDDPSQICCGGLFGQLPGWTASEHRSNTSSLLRWTSIVTPSLVNQARVSFQRIVEDATDSVPYTPQQIGLQPLISSACCNRTTLGSYTQPPFMIVGGAFQIGGSLYPQFAPTNTIQLADQVSWNKGSHNLRYGFEYERVDYPLHFGGLGRGFLIIPSFADLMVGRASCAPGTFPITCNPGNTGLDPRGHPTNGGPVSNLVACLFCVRSTVEGIIHGYRMKNMNAFFQDDWKVNSRLTLNLGVRWEYDGTLADRYGNLTNLWPSDLRTVPLPPSAPSTTNPNSYVGYVVPNNYDPKAHGALPPGVRVFDGKFASINRIPLSNLGPRIGFAWQPASTSRMLIRGGAGIFFDRIGINQIVHAVQEGKPYADTLALQSDIASLQQPFQDRPLAFAPRWFDLNPASPNYLHGSSFDSPFYDRIQTPVYRQYNLGIQYEFARQYVAEIAYVGSSGINEADYSHNVNAARLVCTALVTSQCVQGGINGITTNTQGNAPGRVPYLGFSPIGLQQNGFDGISNYNSLQATVRKNFSQGFGFQVSYTWSKSLSNIGFGSANLNNPNDMSQQYGPVSFSRPHRFVASYLYELPIKSNSSLNYFVSGWSISGVTTMQAGNPITFFDDNGGGVYGTPGSSIDKAFTRAQMAPGATYDSAYVPGDVKDKLNHFFDIKAFAPIPILGEDGSQGYGNSGLGILRGPHQANWDVSVNKVFRIKETQRVQFRADFFNFFNHAQFFLPTLQNNVGTFVNSPATFGVINSTSVSPRLIQLALRYDF
jgi:Carboxypeptidase regulatory-like domain/TonB-dependent Receptor Plug Domain